MILTHGVSNIDRGIQQFVVQGSAQLLFVGADGSGVQNWSANGSNLSSATWYHIIGTWDGTTSSNGAKLYLSTTSSDNTATPNAQSTANSINATPATNNLRIGARPDTSSAMSNGSRIDDLRFFDRVLNASERSAVYSSIS